MTVLYFADTRFPIERANGAQTMGTCQALAARGHDVTLVVRPDRAPQPRDPFDFYGLPHVDRLTITTVPARRGARANRVRFLLAALALSMARRDALVYTRDLGIAAFLLQMPASRRPRLIYESHGIAPMVSAEMPRLLGRPDLIPSPAKLRRLDRRERRVWTRAAAYVTITAALADDLRARYGPRAGLFVVPDGARDSSATAPVTPDATAGPTVVGYAGHLYPWKGVDIFVHALALLPQVHGLIVGGHPGESDRTRIDTLARTLGVGDRLRITGL
ncbi:MAG: glycosyltransferase, partial [Acidobacteriota bacterium]